jgi:hypothetical protein
MDSGIRTRIAQSRKLHVSVVGVGCTVKEDNDERERVGEGS